MKGSSLIVGLLLSVLVSVFGNFDKSAKLIATNGNLILEPSLNGNVSIRLKGQSRFTVNNVDVLYALNGLGNYSMRSGATTSESSDQMPQGNLVVLNERTLNDLKNRIEGLENRTRSVNLNQMLRRTRVRVRSLETRVQTIYDNLLASLCKSNPCENGGVCMQIYDHYVCRCPKEFEGPTCGKDVNECALFAGTDLGCQNGAKCVNQHGGYSCSCAAGWVGIHCTQKSTDCLKASGRELCGHGTCVNANDDFGYKCICDQGWKTNGLTPSCNTDVNECTESHPQCASSCINLPGTFVCGPCPVGFTGNGFSCRDLDECAANNGGCSMRPMVPCINTHGSFHCGECPIGWEGDGRTCNRKKATQCVLCHPSAICNELPNGVVTCSCPPGMTGRGIGQNGCTALPKTACTTNPCQNGGVCTPNGNSYKCVCPAGYKQPNCTLNDICISNPCKNGGTCSTDGLVYSCKCPAGYVGKSCDKERNRCGGVLDSLSGHLKFPPFDDDLYDHSSRCVWLLRTNETKVLNITFSKFEIENSLDCRFDWLQIHDGPSSASQLIGRFCGNQLPKNGQIISTTNRLYMWFRSDNSTAMDGFEFSWNSIEPVCGGTIEVSQHGTIATPGSPGNYPANRDCKWILKAPNDKRIQIVFSGINIGTQGNCDRDYVAIYDGVTTEGVLQYKWCTSANPAPLTISSNEVLVHFHSDNDGSDVGFQLHYSTVERIVGCGGTFSRKRDTINSPAKNPDGGAISCQYSIQLTKGVEMELKFTIFEMQEDDCVEIWDGPAGKMVYVGRWCGQLHPPKYTSVSNEIFVKYHTNGMSEFSLEYRYLCQYVFEEPTGVITSPNYPHHYPETDECIFEILAPSNQVIKLDFQDFHLYDKFGTKCYMEYLEIFDGTTKTSNGKYCGVDAISSTTSSTNMLTLKLITESSGSSRGFKANYSFVDTGNCGGILKSRNGTINSPMGDDNMYIHNLNCIWTIIAPQGWAIELAFSSFHLEQTYECFADHLDIYDDYYEMSSGRQSFGRFCGNNTPPIILSPENVLSINFVSDFSDSGIGFVAKYQFVNTSATCGGNISSSGVGSIKSPNWPGNYTEDMACTWVLRIPIGNQVELTFDVFQLEDMQQNECGDYLEIRNGGFASSPLLGKFCGSTIPKRILSFSNTIFLRFVSNSAVSAKGFVINYDTANTGCGGLLNAIEGSITSPNYPNPYYNSAECEWQIVVNKGSHIDIVIDDIALEELLNCHFDYVTIFNGLSTTGHHIGLFCKESSSGTKLTTTGNKALVQFNTDRFHISRGFSISYKSNCRTNLTTLIGTIESPNYPDVYPSGLDCRWTIMAPKGNQIAIQIVHLQLLRKDSTDPLFEDKKDTLRIIEGNSSKEMKYSSVANSEFETITSKSNIVVVEFRTEIGFGKGFTLEYMVKGCVHTLTESSGTFGSPKYPQLYENDIECIWQIEVEYGTAIELTFIDLDIEDSVNCTSDGIRIYSGTNETSHIGQYCGKKQNITLTSSTHLLNVKFYSNSKIRAKGFQAKYQTVASKCGGVFSTTHGVIQSLNYPNVYEPNLNCQWLINVTNHHVMTITFNELDLEDDCDNDHVSFYNGAAEEDSALIQAFCGDEIPDPFTTTTGTVLVVFKTDPNIEMKGFKFSFQENCGQEINVTDTGRIRYRATQTTQKECVWHLTAAIASSHVTFIPIHVEYTNEVMLMSNRTNEECQNEGIKVYDGSSTSSALKKAFCKDLPPTLVSFGRSLTIQLPLNIFSEFEGIFSPYDNHCGGDLHAISGKFSTPLYPESYPMAVECVWNIIADPGNTIDINFDMMDIADSENCNQDYLEIREGGETGAILGTLCGSELPEKISGLNRLWVKFKSDEDGVGRGFLATYSYGHHNDLNATSGEIYSPKYPTAFASIEPYTWRILVPVENLILLRLVDFNEAIMANVKVYDGYDNTAEEITISESHLLTTNTSSVFIEATRGPFHLKWDVVSKQAVRDNLTSSTAACGYTTMSLGPNAVFLTSPGYPNKYDSLLNCTWILKSEDASKHVTLQFLTMELDNYYQCFSDYVTVSQSSDMINWENKQTFCKIKSNERKGFHGTPYLKLEFHTTYADKAKGFMAKLGTFCGAPLTAPKGIIRMDRLPPQSECVWNIHVRPGRRIKFEFPRFEVRPGRNSHPFLMVKNGIDADSPNLGLGKYELEQSPQLPETTSNYAYIKAFEDFGSIINITMTYKEVSDLCSHRIELSNSTVITSTNYPLLPKPHSECVWTVVAPVDRTVSIQFLDTFDLTPSALCDKEYLQLNDGASELAKPLGRFCGATRPNTVYSTGNILRVKHFTDVTEPKIGFKAEVKLAVCGGTYHTQSGTIIFPGSLTASFITNDTIKCEYRINAATNTATNLTIDANYETPIYDDFAPNCEDTTRIEIFSLNGPNEEETAELDEPICTFTKSATYTISSDKILIRITIKKNLKLPQIKLKYNFFRQYCVNRIESTSGVLKSPGYPYSANRRVNCVYYLTVPKGRRVKLDFLDIDIPQNNFWSLAVANDHEFMTKSVNLRMSFEKLPSQPVYSSDNLMAIQIYYRNTAGTYRGFKLQFSSDETTVDCNHDFSDVSGTFSLKDNNETISLQCTFPITVAPQQTLALRFSNVRYISGSVSMICSYFPPLQIISLEPRSILSKFCSNETQNVVVPFSVNLLQSKAPRFGNFSTDVFYKYHNCGGVETISNAIHIVNPNMTKPNYGVIDCAWKVSTSPLEERNLEITISTKFKGNCVDEYVVIYAGPSYIHPHLGKFCSEVNRMNFSSENGIFIQYHSANYNPQTQFDIIVQPKSICGGRMRFPFQEINFRSEYVNNVECMWIVSVTPGYHIGVEFYDRFFIETSDNCTKDYIRIEERVEGEWKMLQTICGRNTPSMINASSTEVRVIFRSDAETVGDGFSMRFHRKCGGMYYATDEVQTLSSPGFPQTYDPNLNCTYTIKAPGNEIVRMNFIDFDLMESYECIVDAVTIRTKSSRFLPIESRKFCDTDSIKTINSIGMASIQFVTNRHTFPGRGFKLEYSLNKCGGVITNSTTISLQPINVGHMMFMRCYWNITAPDNYKIAIQFHDFRVKATPTCYFDYVEVFQGLAMAREQRLARICGMLEHTIPRISVPTNTAVIHSYTYADVTSQRSFQADIMIRKQCDKQISLTATESKYILDDYDNGYDNDLDCNYVFAAPSGYQLRIKFSSFHLEDSNSDCNSDWLEIRDGAGPFAGSFGKYCGHLLPPSMVSSKSSLFVHFATDSTETSQGFKAEITAVPTICGASPIEVKPEKNVVLKFPGNGLYPPNTNCHWKLTSEVHNINLHFDKMDIQEGSKNTSSCNSDYLEIFDDVSYENYGNELGKDLTYNGFTESIFMDSIRHVYCGNQLPGDLYAKSTEVFLRFHSDATYQKSGFQITASAVNGCLQNFTNTHGRIQLTDFLNCTVYINVPQNYSLSLYYRMVDIYNVDCENDNIEIFDANTNKSLQRLCHYTDAKKNLFTTTNALKIVFKSKTYMASSDISYLASKMGPGCSADIVGYSGTLTNPFYPLNMRNNSDCRWNIQVPSNKKVQIMFSDFNLGSKSTCKSDYLQFIETDINGKEEIVRQYCGDEDPTSFTSTRNQLSIRFKKTVNYDGTGWALTYRAVSSTKSTNLISLFN